VQVDLRRNALQMGHGFGVTPPAAARHVDGFASIDSARIASTSFICEAASSSNASMSVSFFATYTPPFSMFRPAKGIPFNDVIRRA